MEENGNDTDQISSEEESSSNADTRNDFIRENDRESTMFLREALNHLLSLCGNTNRTWITHNYQRCTGKVRLNYLPTAHPIIRNVMRIMLSYEIDYLERDLLEHYHNRKLIKYDDHFLSAMKGV